MDAFAASYLNSDWRSDSLDSIVVVAAAAMRIHCDCLSTKMTMSGLDKCFDFHSYRRRVLEFHIGRYDCEIVSIHHRHLCWNNYHYCSRHSSPSHRPESCAPKTAIPDHAMEYDEVLSL